MPTILSGLDALLGGHRKLLITGVAIALLYEMKASSETAEIQKYWAIAAVAVGHAIAQAAVDICRWKLCAQHPELIKTVIPPVEKDP